MCYVEVVNFEDRVISKAVFGGRPEEEVLDELTAKLTGTYKLRIKKAYLALPDKHLKTYEYDSDTDELTKVAIN